MFGIGGGEIVVIVIIALLVFGPQKIPEIARAVKRFYQEFTKVRSQVDDTITELRQEIDLKARIEDEVKPIVQETTHLLDKEPVKPPERYVEASDKLSVPETDDYLLGQGSEQPEGDKQAEADEYEEEIRGGDY